MIGAIVMVFVLIWVYQTATKANVNNTIIWVMICAGVFVASQVILIYTSVYLLEAFRGGGGDEGYERDLMSIGDRKNVGGFQGSKGSFLSVFMELMPPVVGFLLVAVIRTKFVLKESLTKTNLFSGFGDMFRSIKDSFKNPDQK